MKISFNCMLHTVQCLLQCLHHAEMAQRTHETPPGLQYDNVAPIEYFIELVAGFERDMQVFRQEIENTEKHILSLSQPMALTPQGNYIMK